MSESFDVVVVGGGPAGLGAAGALAIGGRKVALFERTDYDEPRIGETFGGEIGPLLAAIGAAEAMRDLLAAQVPFRAIRSAWGKGALDERASIAHPFGDGVHVDRARFDERLLAWASSVGVSVQRGAGTCAVTKGRDAVRVTPARGAAREGRFFVDASGRGAPAGKAWGGRRWLASDRQVAVVARMTAPAPRDVETDLLLEAAEEGWWYSVPQPDGALVVALITDADLLPAGGRTSLPSRFLAALGRTVHTAERASGLALSGSLRVVRAESGCLLPDRGPGWRAAGDAAMACDPLAGNGVARALRSARAVADAILAEAEDAEPRALDRFAAYLDRRAALYLHEARWPDAPFWARRRAVAWADEPLTLDPETILRATGARSPRDLAHAESLLPPRAIAAALDALREPRPAHAAMSTLRDEAPLGDRRLLVGLQLLVERGAVRRA